jgi:flagellar L-ring protein precursor FlgH
MTANPSLWPDEGQGAALFRDFRAFESMDVITILVNENTVGKKKTGTDAKSEFSITAAISNFFGIETKDWAANNESLDPTNLINAETETDLKAKGETKREGKLLGRLSAVIMEVLPNGLLRIEGTKIVSVDNEEETMILSGLVRQRDVDAENQVDSSRIANMRIDFYGRGILGEQTNYGWGVRLFKFIWPF